MRGWADGSQQCMCSVWHSMPNLHELGHDLHSVLSWSQWQPSHQWHENLLTGRDLSAIMLFHWILQCINIHCLDGVLLLPAMQPHLFLLHECLGPWMHQLCEHALDDCGWRVPTMRLEYQQLVLHLRPDQQLYRQDLYIMRQYRHRLQQCLYDSQPNSRISLAECLSSHMQHHLARLWNLHGPNHGESVQ